MADDDRLIFGTPVPGYSAPPEATTIADSLMRVLVEAFAGDAAPAGRALTFWTRLHGVVSLEIAGHFAGMDFDPALHYAAETCGAVVKAGARPRRYASAGRPRRLREHRGTVRVG
ncbi:TetR-like C-terminal domain-containing protein [Couchioplanes caeruleus]|uniref:HTH-type transcriptional regulator MT1864/Rv1816-like C-terminal domain-containing protein n=1 Tax=Couchioplanes caeruleus subsp. caeruleus TaxID=56427 RepID=A0A1K0GJL8_9ACTN|nr:TetR-like C-terminal domain-containing protein [Couchioplanes caeruleus]OJF11148.1 hypothetical protein BG844_27965 [Couchioplanes caeruleus subsp. caeruleus]